VGSPIFVILDAHGFFYLKDHYYASFPRDKNGIKVIVYTLLTLELAQTIIMSYFA